MTKKYDKDFKLQTVQMIQEEGKTVAQIARELGISDNTLYRQIAEYKQDGKQAFPGSRQLKPDDKAVRDLQQRVRDLEEENDILKKAMHYFAKDRRLSMLSSTIIATRAESRRCVPHSTFPEADITSGLNVKQVSERNSVRSWSAAYDVFSWTHVVFTEAPKSIRYYVNKAQRYQKRRWHAL